MVVLIGSGCVVGFCTCWLCGFVIACVVLVVCDCVAMFGLLVSCLFYVWLNVVYACLGVCLVVVCWLYVFVLLSVRCCCWLCVFSIVVLLLFCCAVVACCCCLFFVVLSVVRVWFKHVLFNDVLC